MRRIGHKADAVPGKVVRVKSREEALRTLVPKMLGIICDKAERLPGRLGRTVRLSLDVELSGCGLGANRVMLSAFSSVKGRILKVFSAHVTDSPGAGDPTFYRYVEGSVGLLSWRRGEWEDAVLADSAKAKSPAESLCGGFFQD